MSPGENSTRQQEESFDSKDLCPGRMFVIYQDPSGRLISHGNVNAESDCRCATTTGIV